MNGDIELSANDESIREYEREQAVFARQCPALNEKGERCTFTLHRDRHSWVIKVPHDHMNPDGSEQTPRRG